MISIVIFTSSAPAQSPFRNPVFWLSGFPTTVPGCSAKLMSHENRICVSFLFALISEKSTFGMFYTCRVFPILLETCFTSKGLQIRLTRRFLGSWYSFQTAAFVSPVNSQWHVDKTIVSSTANYQAGPLTYHGKTAVEKVEFPLQVEHTSFSAWIVLTSWICRTMQSGKWWF